jgi:ABC-type amino acid transport system permease subunit
MTHTVNPPPQSSPELQIAPRTTSQDSGASQYLSFDNLAEREKWRFVWGFLWRSICAGLVSLVAGFVVGFVLGLIIAIVARVSGTSSADYIWTIRIVGGICGFGVGIAVLWQLIRWYFRANWFGHRLVLLRADA